MNCFLQIISTPTLIYRIIVDSIHFIVFSVAKVASFYPPTGKPVELYPFGCRTVLFSTNSASYHILDHPKHRQNYCTRFGNDSGLKKLGMHECGVIWNNSREGWKESRECFQHGLKHKPTLVNIAETAPEIVSHVMKNMPDDGKGAIHMLDALRWITLNYTMMNLLGLPPVEGWSRASVMIEAIVAYFKAWEFFLVRPPWSIWWRREYHIHEQSIATLQDISRQLVNDFEEKRQSQSVSGRDFCCLHHAHNKFQANRMTRAELQQLTLEMLLAGVDTSSVTMFYSLGYLAEHPEWMEKVKQEVWQTNFPVKSLQSMPVLRACLNESMRMKPVGPIIMRRAQKSDIVDGIEINAGDQIILHLAAMNVYQVDNSHCFDPSRFLKRVDGVDFGFYPFGGSSPKGCVGKYLAMMEMLATFQYLLRRWTISKPDGGCIMSDMETNWDIAQQPQCEKDMYMVIKPRKVKRVFLVGPSSTGKTTLINKLKEELPDAILHQEIARTLLVKLGMDRNDLNDNPVKASKFQRLLVKEYSQLQKQNVGGTELELFDRCAIDCIVYAKILCLHEEAEDLEGSEDFAANCLVDYRSDESVVLLFPIVEALRHDDGVRRLPSLENHLDEARVFEETLERLKIPFHKVSTSLEHRHHEILSIIKPDWNQGSI